MTKSYNKITNKTIKNIGFLALTAVFVALHLLISCNNLNANKINSTETNENTSTATMQDQNQLSETLANVEVTTSKFSTEKETSITQEEKIPNKLEKPDLTSQVFSPTFDINQAINEAEQYFKSSQKWQKLKCTPKTAFICTKRECNKRDFVNFIILDKKNKKVHNCQIENSTNCTIYPAFFDQTGVFFNIQTKDALGVLIRVLGDSRYKSIATIGLDAYISNGECEEIN